MLFNALRRQIRTLLEHSLTVYWAVRAPHILSRARSTARLLEIGCGSGTWTSHLAAQTGTLVTLDLQPERVAATRRRTERNGRANVLFLTASGEQLPLRNGSFDRVISVDVIEHIPDDGKTMREIARVTRSGGDVLLTTLLEARPAYLRKVVFADHLREYEPDAFAQLFRQGGLEERERFFFYYVWSIVAAEIQRLAQKPLGEVRLIGVGLRALLSLLARFDRLLPLGRPGGIGIVARKPDLADHSVAEVG